MSDSPARPSTVWLSALATVAGNLFLVVGTIVLSTLGLLLSWLPPPGRWMFTMMRLWSKALLAVSGVRVAAQYDPALDPGRSYVFLCNHQSLYDIPALISTWPGVLRMVAKRGLFWVPFFGWALWAGGFIPVDRSDRSGARQTFAAAAARLRQGISVLFFPEGTRAPGDTLLPFQRGGFLLALKSGLPIVPVGVRGTRAIRSRGGFRIHPGSAAVAYGAPIDPAAFGLRRKRELVEEVQRQVAALSGMALPASPEDPGEASD